MSTYKELQSQIEKLQKEAEQARKTELANAIADIHAKMKEFGISAEDLGFGGGKRVKSAKPAVRRTVAPKYRNTATGETWSGRGLQPKWLRSALAAGRKLSDFAV